MKFFFVTTMMKPGMPRTELSSTLPSVAPTVGGRTTAPCTMPGRGSRLCQVPLVEARRRRLAPRRRPLIRRDGGVALNQPDVRDRDRQFLGDELRLHREDALAELALAGVRRHGTVGGDRDPR